ncbi:MAG: hypothetical protein WD512_07890 [Candidatus Paceibacterota bacterium]
MIRIKFSPKFRNLIISELNEIGVQYKQEKNVRETSGMNTHTYNVFSVDKYPTRSKMMLKTDWESI